MTNRTRLGNTTLFGTPGIYISQPDDNVNSPTKSLLLDSRAGNTLNIHFQERVQLFADDKFNGSFDYTTAQSYPNLGYNPKYYFSVVERSSNIATYPMGVFRRRSGLQTVDANFGPSGMSITINILGNEIDLDLMYVVFRNRANG